MTIDTTDHTPTYTQSDIHQLILEFNKMKFEFEAMKEVLQSIHGTLAPTLEKLESSPLGKMMGL